ncbi:hypothetical protein B566_EDAN003731 [Ephemera danica]|nr:hypothetical protein B566_EDAN003731 [Ephemera danica]
MHSFNLGWRTKIQTEKMNHNFLCYNNASMIIWQFTLCFFFQAMKVLRGLRLLLWKNWLLQRRHPVQSVIEILAPVVFTALLVVVRSLVVPTEFKAPTKYNSFAPGVIPVLVPPMLTINNTKYVLGWTPDHPGLREVMARAAWSAGFEESVFESEESLEANLTSEEGTSRVPMMGGVVFRGDFNGTDIPEELEVRIRFPSVQKIVYVESNTWLTDRLFPDYQVTGPRTKGSERGGPPYYSQKGWLGVQHAIGMSLIEYLTGESQQGTRVRMSRFPYPAYVDDPLLDAMKSFVSLTFMLSFVYTSINAVRCVTTEKEKQLKESMKIMGLPGWLHWSAWFLNFMTLLLIAVVLMVILMKVDWYGNTNTAATIAGVAWFFSYAPYYFVEEAYASMSLVGKLAACLASNTAMAFGCQIIVQFEGTGEGQQWYNLFTPASLNDNLTLGSIMIMFVVDACLYMTVALYVEAVFPGEYGVPLPFYFPFQKSYWFPSHNDTVPQPKVCGTVVDSYFEEEPSHLPAGIQIINLHKSFGGKVAVRGLNLNMYEGHITALLGHNGAGKTTTMAMLTGLLIPSGGTAVVGGCDIRRDIRGARASLGLCPQHNILFDELTVTEHLRFFCKVKGLLPEEEEMEVSKYIKLLSFESKENAQAHTLSGGMKRKLSVGVALCGGSKVVMLDEPTSGMDPSARRTLWDILEAEKAGRTILLTTHFMDEADLLGDRIAIMANGKLQCSGSSFFLKKKYGSGYQLGIARSRECNVEAVTSLLRQHVPSTQLVQDVGSELSYRLPEEFVSKFEVMLADLEVKGPQLGVQGFGVSMTTMEEVFVKAGHDGVSALDDNDEEIPPEPEMFNNLVSPQSSNAEYPAIYAGATGNEVNNSWAGDNSVVISSKENLYHGPRLIWNQFYAMLMKKILSTARSWLLYLIQTVLPIAFLIIVILVSRVMPGFADHPPLEITLASYPDVITVTELGQTSYATEANMYQTYKSLVEPLSVVEEVPDTYDMQEYLIQLGMTDLVRYRSYYMVGSTFEYNEDLRKTQVMAWFSNQPHHATPLALNLVHNTLLQHYVKNSTRSIKLVNHPLPFDSQSKVIRQLSGTLTKGFQYAFNIGFSMAFVSSFYVLFCVRERATKAKHLQVVSGVRGWMFWLTAFIWDWFIFLGPTFGIIFTFAAFQEEGLRTVKELGVATFMVVVVLKTPGLYLEDVARMLEWIFMLFPHYNVTMSIFNLYQTYLATEVCSDILPY